MAVGIAFALTEKFKGSYLNYQKYPLNIISVPTYGRPSLKLYRKRYLARQPTLCVGVHDQKKLPFRDISLDGQVKKQNVFTERELKLWLGDTTTLDPSDPTNIKGDLATKPDPRCRFM